MRVANLAISFIGAILSLIAVVVSAIAFTTGVANAIVHVSTFVPIRFVDEGVFKISFGVGIFAALLSMTITLLQSWCDPRWVDGRLAEARRAGLIVGAAFAYTIVNIGVGFYQTRHQDVIRWTRDDSLVGQVGLYHHGQLVRPLTPAESERYDRITTRFISAGVCCFSLMAGLRLFEVGGDRRPGSESKPTPSPDAGPGFDVRAFLTELVRAFDEGPPNPRRNRWP